jgi:hypothetical protein
MLRQLPRAVAALFGLIVAVVAASPARASVSLEVAWEDLVRESTSAAVVTPVDSRSVWEDGRVYTYTHVHVDRAVAGDLGTGDHAWVRTMGGVVGTIGQLVEGEAVLAKGRPSLLFLRPGPAGTLRVTARAQGQFPVVADPDPTRPAHLVRSNATGALLPARAVPAPPLARDMLHGRIIDDAAREIVTAWGRVHAG